MPILGLIIDMDGVLWRGNEPIGNLPATFEALKSKKIKIILATNNATSSAEQYQAKLRSFGVELRSDQIINSSAATARYLQTKYPAGGKVFIIGESGLVSALQECGFEQAEQDVLAVVVGMDRTITYQKLAKATLLIRAGAVFIGTNPDRTFPIPEGLVPGAGSILAALQAATDLSPLIIGKPSPEMYRAALERMQIHPNQVVVVGDRLETDIAGAQALGCRTALVLSGVTTQAMAEKWQPAPDWIAPDLSSLVKELNAAA